MKRQSAYIFVLSFGFAVLFSLKGLAADRYWVGGLGNWSDTLHWSASSGGASGSSVPTSSDNVFVNGLSGVGSYSVIIDIVTASCKNMDWTGSSAVTLVGGSTRKLFIFGSLTINSSVTNGFIGQTHFKSTTLGQTVTSGGFVFIRNVYFDGVGGGWALSDTFLGIPNACDVYLLNGSLNSNNNDITCKSFFNSNTNVRSLDLGTSTITLTETWDISDPTNLSFTAGSSTVIFNNQFGITLFNGGDLTYNYLVASDILEITITGSNTFNTISVTPISTPTDIILKSSNTQTLSFLILNTSIQTLNISATTAGIAGTFFKATGKICVENVGIQDNIATGGAAFYAGVIPPSSDNGNVTGWIFSDCPDTLSVNIVPTNLPCKGLCLGIATAVVTPGTPPYTYQWYDSVGSSIPGETGSVLDTLCPGTYSVRVIDLVPDTAFASVVITEPTELLATTSVASPISCNGVCDGQATANPTGGTPSYTYSWNTIPVQNSKTATGLCPSTAYTVTVTDANGCAKTASITLANPPILTSSITSFNNVSCKGGFDGSATVTPLGGTTSYSFLWDDPANQTTSTATGLYAAFYNVVVTDANGCMSVSSVNITEPAFTISSAITGSSNASCGGICDGSITVTPSGGISPYSYLWDDTGSQTDSVATALCADTFHVTITDSEGCITTDTFTITEPPVLTSVMTNTIGPACFGGCNGTATVTPSGGTPPYTYLWSGGGTPTDSTNTILCGIVYNVTVTDNIGCETINSASLIDPPELVVTIVNSVNANCFGTCSGSAMAAASGGTPPYTFTWDDPASQSNDTASNLCAGFYTITLTDGMGCDTTDTVTIISPMVLTATTDVSCAAVCDGKITTTPVGGTIPYTYQWHDSIPWTIKPGEIDSIIDSLCTGSYCVIITDNNGCADTICVSINLPSITTTTKSPSCPGICDGEGVVIAAGGSGPYTYQWKNTAGTILGTDSNLTGLCVGKYYIQVTNSLSCVLTDSIQITDRPPLTVSVTDSTKLLCSGDCNGTATSVAAGGTSPYTYLWNDPLSQNTAFADSLCLGTFVVIVTDSLGCDTGKSVIIGTPAPLTATITSSNDVVCGGDCDGNATVTPTGGTAPYTYKWDDPSSQTTSSALNLCADTYIVTVTDTSNCNATDTVVITEPVPLTGSVSGKTDINCFGNCSGSATFSAAGGTGIYTYLWDDPSAQITATAAGLCPGLYNVTVTDENNCSATDDVTITEPPLLTATITGSDSATCGGLCDGKATIAPAGGISPYTILWDDGQTTGLAIALCAGIRVAVITDANGCSASDSVEIFEPPVLISTITDSTDVNCKGACDGSAVVFASGGTGIGTYIYLWNDPPSQTNDTAAALCPNAYSVTVTDANNCKSISSVTITEPPVLSITMSPAVGICSIICDIQAVASVTGGVPSYTFLWDDPSSQTNDTATGLCTDIKYHVTVTDANGCIDVDSVTTSTPPVLGLSIVSTTSASCGGLCDGGATVSGFGGIRPYTYSWNTSPVQPDSFATGLCATSYVATVTDDMGCVAAKTVSITGPGGLTASISGVTDLICNSVCNGVAVVSAAGGTSPYSYEWSDPASQTNDTATGLCAGRFVCTITDANTCIAISDTAVITQPPALVLTIPDSSTSCNGACDGASIASATGGIPPYSYSWNDPGSQTDSLATGLCAGTYNVTVTDANGCTSTSDVQITEPAPITVTFSFTSPGCIGNCDGTATASAIGGTPAYTFLWDDPALQTDSGATGLCAGKYRVTITDINSCLKTDSVTVTEPDTLAVSDGGVVNSGCTVCNGEATVTAAGGTLPYTYSWNDPLTQNTSTADSLCTGTYNVTVTDINNCSAELPFTITGPAGFTASITDTSNVSCNGLCDGVSVVTPVGGVAPYSFLWDDIGVQTDSAATGLCALDYIVTVTDNNGCIALVPITITQPATLTSGITSSTDIICNGLCNGSATATPSGGTTPFTYLWDDPSSQTNDTASSLCADTFNIQITDANGCTATSDVILTEPIVLTVTINGSANVTCNGGCDGFATAGALGGATPYTYQWDDPASQINDTAFNLCPGNYTVFVTDSFGCPASTNIIITEPAVLSISSVTITNASCKNLCDGDASVAISGGSGSYNFQWNDPSLQTTQTATGLCDGIYSITVTDLGGCGTVSGTANITEPTAITVSVSKTNVTCFGACDGMATATASGGTGGLTYLWNDILSQTNDTAIGLCATASYTVTVTDENTCSKTAASALITQPVDSLTLDTLSTSQSGCFPVCDGSATVFASGGKPLYTYQWNDPASQTGTTATGLCISTYTVTVTDANNCTATLSVIITGPGGLSSSISAFQNLTCNSSCDGQATVTPSGGALTYTYLWDDPDSQITGTATGLCAGNFTATVTDGTGCITTSTVSITEPLVFSSSITDSNDVSCGGLPDGYATVTASGGKTPYTFVWNDPASQTTATATGLSAGVYCVTVTSSSGCGTVAICVTIDGSLTLAISSADIICFGKCDGTATASASGGSIPYTYLWNDPASQTTATAIGLCAGTYTVTVTDAGVCSGTASVNITEPVILTAAFTDSSDVSCNGLCDGSAIVNGSGGTGGYTYLWNDPSSQATAIANNLCAGTYNVNVSDNNGCIASANSVTISESPVLVADTVSTSVSGCLVCNANATVAASGGTSPYTYSWNDPGFQSGASATGLCAGTYTVSVTDFNNCTTNLKVVIFGPAAITASITDTAYISCAGVCDGALTVTATGGTSPYTYSWDSVGVNLTGETNPAISDLCAAYYTANITDANGCIAIAPITVTAPDVFISSIPPGPYLTCGTSCTGSISVDISGGTAPYTYLWNDPASQTSSTASGLCAGPYIVQILDTRGCYTDAGAIVTSSPVPTSSITDSTNVSCNGIPDGTATVTPSSGVVPYFYLWDDIGSQSDSTATGLWSGTYSVTVTDAVGCKTTSVVIITDTSSMTAGIIKIKAVSCNGLCDGSLVATASGSLSPYTYIWSDPSSQANDTASNLCPNSYFVTVTSSENCTRLLSENVPEPALLAGNIASSSGVSCPNTCDGNAVLLAIGGTSPYTFLWSNGESNDTAKGLCTGSNIVTVTDANLCTAKDTVILSAASGFSVSSFVTNSNCSSVNDGAIDVTVTGGTTPYTYLWSGGDTIEDLVDIFANTYTLSVTESSGCAIVDTMIVSVVTTIAANAGQDTIICSGNTATLNSQIAGDSLLWSTGSKSVSVTVSPSITTIYKLTIYKGACSAVDTVIVVVNPSPVVDAGTDKVISTGAIAQLNASGGFISYLWSPSTGLSDSVIAGPSASPGEDITYYVTVIDANGCSAKDSVRVEVKPDFPDGLTPNGDGYNDVWEIPLLEKYPNASVEVYNRWGERIFLSPEGEKYATKFNGTYNGSMLPVGTYYYIINLNDGGEVMTGPVTIMR